MWLCAVLIGFLAHPIQFVRDWWANRHNITGGEEEADCD
jgi:hypothetical protein